MQSEALFASPSCCVVIPVYSLHWSDSERIAVSRCLRLLREQDVVILHKQSISPDALWAGCIEPATHAARHVSFQSIEDHHLASVAAYNKLMLSPSFYRLFSAWDFLLLFQLDAWILGGDLKSWLKKDYSYIGAPWFAEVGPHCHCPALGVGNGGLSLRKVRDLLRVLESPRFRYWPLTGPREIVRRKNLWTGYQHLRPWMRPFGFALRFGRVLLACLGRQNTLAYLASIGEQEDILFGLHAPKVFSWLRIPSVAQAAHFALETNPREIMETFGVDEMPFGCHAWEKHDKGFFLERFAEEFAELHPDPDGYAQR